MKITQKQLLMLYEIVVASASMANPLGFDQETRQKLVNDILNQQDDKDLLTPNSVGVGSNESPSQ